MITTQLDCTAGGQVTERTAAEQLQASLEDKLGLEPIPIWLLTCDGRETVLVALTEDLIDNWTRMGLHCCGCNSNGPTTSPPLGYMGQSFHGPVPFSMGGARGGGFIVAMQRKPWALSLEPPRGGA